MGNDQDPGPHARSQAVANNYNTEFHNLWKEISEALLRIAGSISQAKKDEWGKSINKQLCDPLTPEAQRCVNELNMWYRNDMEIKDLVEQVRNELQQVSLEVRDQNNIIQQLNQKLGNLPKYLKI